MDTQTQDPTNDIDTLPVDPSWRVADVDKSPAYEFRAAFRPKVMEFFEQTNKRNGAYKWAERQAKEWFFLNHNIAISAWHYRNRREKVEVE